MLYNFLKILLRIIMIPFVKIEVQNMDNFPQKGPVLLACNHLSNWDPVILAIALPEITFMAKKNYSKY